MKRPQDFSPYELAVSAISYLGQTVTRDYRQRPELDQLFISVIVIGQVKG